MSAPDRALSVRQPWADLLCTGQKRYETRGWRTTRRGWVLIHASARPKVPGLPAGAIVGAVRIVACHRVEDIRRELSRAELERGDYSAGRFAWEVADVRKLDAPIPYSGGLSFWAVDTATAARVARLLSL